MRKYLIGILIGVALTVSATTYAADITSLIGKSVQGVFPVKVNGDVLPKTAIVIDGTSYLPVRAIGDAIGYDVSFNADLGIELKKKEVVSMSSVTPSTTTVTQEAYDSETIDSMIRINKNFITASEEQIKENPDSPNIANWNMQLQRCKDQLAIWEARKAALPQ